MPSLPLPRATRNWFSRRRRGERRMYQLIISTGRRVARRWEVQNWVILGCGDILWQWKWSFWYQPAGNFMSKQEMGPDFYKEFWIPCLHIKAPAMVRPHKVQIKQFGFLLIKCKQATSIITTHTIRRQHESGREQWDWNSLSYCEDRRRGEWREGPNGKDERQREGRTRLAVLYSWLFILGPL